MMFCLGLTGNGCGKSVEEQIAEQLNLGQKYLAEQNYEEAIIIFNKVIELEPKEWEAYKGIFVAYAGQGNSQEAVSFMEKGISIIGIEEISDGDLKLLVEIYSNLSEEMALAGDLELVMNCYNRMLELQPQDAELQEKIAEKRQIYKYENDLKKMAFSIAKEDKYDFEDELILSEKFQNKVIELKEPIIFKSDDYYVGIYPGGYIYYGDMINGSRNGNGYWYYGNIKRMTKAHGIWKDDVPDGMAVIETFINPEEIVRKEGEHYAVYIRKNGDIKKGVYEGRWNIYWDMEEENACNHEWNVTYENGIMSAIEGNDAAYCIKCNARLHTNKNMDQIEGVN